MVSYSSLVASWGSPADEEFADGLQYYEMSCFASGHGMERRKIMEAKFNATELHQNVTEFQFPIAEDDALESTNYSCCIYAITNIGEGPPVCSSFMVAREG